jgi:hypothetical protein
MNARMFGKLSKGIKEKSRGRSEPIPGQYWGQGGRELFNDLLSIDCIV